MREERGRLRKERGGEKDKEREVDRMKKKRPRGE